MYTLLYNTNIFTKSILFLGIDDILRDQRQYREEREKQRQKDRMTQFRLQQTKYNQDLNIIRTLG